ncbi:MAG: hypothetical protein GY810_22670 [Aureispira sp.]|nr:hypothetical protein [Aureispira sp.]
MVKDTDISKQSHLGVDIATHIAFAVLGLMAIYFYQERLFGDTAFFVAKVIHNEALQIEHGRWILAFHEWLPFLAVKLGASIKTILILYSLAHVLFFYSLYLITRYVYNSIAAGFLLLGIQVVGMDYGYYSPGFELYYATGFMVWFAVALEHGKQSTGQYFLLTLLTYIISTSHPTTLPVLGLILVWHWYHYRWKFLKIYVLILSCMLAVFAYKQLFPTWYEILRMKDITGNLYERSFLNSTYLSGFVEVMWDRYFALVLVFFATVVYLLWKRLWMMLVVFLVAIFVIQYMNVLAYPVLEHTRYQEQCYYPIVMVVIFLLGMDFLPKLEGRQFLIGSLFWGAIIVYRIIGIYDTGHAFVDRSDTMRRLITHCQGLEGNKFKVKEENIDYLGLGTNWSYPIETMLLSKINPANKTVTICYNRDFRTGARRLLMAENEYLFRLDEAYPDKSVNPDYFELKPGYYLPLNGGVGTIPEGKELADLNKIREALELKVLDWPTKYKVGEQLFIPIELLNKGAEKLNSDRVYLGFQWIQSDTLVPIRNNKTPIELDVAKAHQQYLQVTMPKVAGTYKLKLGVIVADRYWEWLDVGAEQTVTVD